MHDPAEPSSGFLNPLDPIGNIDAAPETRSVSASAVSMPVAEFAKDQGRAESRALAERRILGAYYTPERLSQILSDWAIRAPHDTVLEPSFGGCGFLATARTTLARLGCADPVRQIHGCDIDPVAFEYLTDVFGSTADIRGFVQRDFLDCDAVAAWPQQFSVVLANPPYIPHHRIGKNRVRELWKRPQGVAGVKGRASLWAYFLSHAVTLLQPGGRMAWVLPGAFLQADYATPIRAYLGREFARSAAFVIHERLFLTEGADEETVILLAEGHGQPPIGDGLEVGEAGTLAELETLIARWAVHGWAGRTGAVVPAMLSLTDEAEALFDRLIVRPYTVTLGTIAKVQIGLVTGDNAFFVLDRAAITSANLVDDDCARILSKFRAAAGISLTIDDLDHYDRTGGKSFLIQSSGATTSVALQTYLDTYPADRRDAVSTFRKRPVWSTITDGNVPHAFFPVMHHDGPRLVLNTADINCTNTIHRVFFKNDLPVWQQRLAALSMLTTFSQISAELCGRRYGSGVLKHEPRDTDRIHLMMPDNVDPTDLDRVYCQADARSREGDTDGVRAIADVALLRWSGVVLTRDQRDLLGATLAAMRARRRPDRRITSNGRSTSGLAPSNH